MNSIEKRLAASLNMDAINGDSSERSVVSKQINEAIKEIITLRARIAELEADVGRFRALSKLSDIQNELEEVMADRDRLAKELEAARKRNEKAIRGLQSIANADYRKWDDGLNSPEEFVLWAKNIAGYTLQKAVGK